MLATIGHLLSARLKFLLYSDIADSPPIRVAYIAQPHDHHCLISPLSEPPQYSSGDLYSLPPEELETVQTVDDLRGDYFQPTGDADLFRFLTIRRK